MNSELVGKLAMFRSSVVMESVRAGKRRSILESIRPISRQAPVDESGRFWAIGSTPFESWRSSPTAGRAATRRSASPAKDVLSYRQSTMSVELIADAIGVPVWALVPVALAAAAVLVFLSLIHI